MQIMIITALFGSLIAGIAGTQYNKNHNPALSKSQNSSMASYYFFVIVCILIFGIVSGLRYYVGTDFGSYYWKYPRWSASMEMRLKDWDEPGLAVLARLLHYITDDGAILIMSTSLITAALYIFTLSKNTDNFCYCIIIYVLCGCWSGAFNGVRQYIAAAILFAGHKLIFERKFLKFCLVVFLASSFHITALIMLPMYFIVTKHLDLKKILFIIVFGIVLVYSYDFLFKLVGVMKDNESGGADTNYAQRSINALRIPIAIAPLILYFVEKIMKKEFTGRENFYICLLFIRAALVFGTQNSAYLNRVSLYFDIFIPLGLILLINKMDPEYRTLLKIITISLYFVAWIYADAINVEWEWMFNRPSAFTSTLPLEA